VLALLEPGGVRVTSVRLTGTATRIAGAETDTGSVTLEAVGDVSSRVELDLDIGTRLEAHQRVAGGPRAADETAGKVRQRTVGDAWSPAAWFLPQLALAAVGTDGLTASAAAPDHLRLIRQVRSVTKGMTAEIARLSQTDLYLDPASGLPARLDFNRYPTAVNKFAEPVEIRYIGWHTEAGAEVPARIERWVNGVRRLTVSITQAEINPAIPVSHFNLGGAQ
jgi:hypothetical protein